MKGEITTNKTYQEISDSYFSKNKTIDSILWEENSLRNNQEFIKTCLYHANNNVKYNGKYAFIRICHAQEIVSSIFSFLSAVSALISLFCLFYIKQKHSTLSSSSCRRTMHTARTNDLSMHSTTHTFTHSTFTHTSIPKYYTTLKWTLFIHCCTWIGSCIFHVRDCYATQCIDYFGAILSISSTILLSFRRLSIPSVCLQRVLSVFVLCHVLYMHCVRFDYAYNSFACGVLFVLNGGLWSFWYGRIRRHPYSRMLSLSIFGIGCAGSFQVIDFGPIYFLLDSHALWHIIGWIFSTLLYAFFLLDFYVLIKASTTGHSTVHTG